jgi:hypothetical protein
LGVLTMPSRGHERTLSAALEFWTLLAFEK